MWWSAAVGVSPHFLLLFSVTLAQESRSVTIFSKCSSSFRQPGRWGDWKQTRHRESAEILGFNQRKRSHFHVCNKEEIWSYFKFILRLRLLHRIKTRWAIFCIIYYSLCLRSRNFQFCIQSHFVKRNCWQDGIASGVHSYVPHITLLVTHHGRTDWLWHCPAQCIKRDCFQPFTRPPEGTLKHSTYIQFVVRRSIRSEWTIDWVKSISATISTWRRHMRTRIKLGWATRMVEVNRTHSPIDDFYSAISSCHVSQRKRCFQLFIHSPLLILSLCSPPHLQHFFWLEFHHGQRVRAYLASGR